MTDDQAVREVQRALRDAGLYSGRVDGAWGPVTDAAWTRARGRLAPAPDIPARSGLERIIWHWTGGTHRPSALDFKHYHFVIAGDGSVVAGDRVPEDNVSASDGRYAAHTRNCNTGSIGIALAAMHGARERPFEPGAYPIQQAQADALVRLSAELARRYGIPVSRTTMLSHAEVQPTLGIKQAGKWDFMWLPGMAGTADPVALGDQLRGRVAAALEGD